MALVEGMKASSSISSSFFLDLKLSLSNGGYLSSFSSSFSLFSLFSPFFGFLGSLLVNEVKRSLNKGLGRARGIRVAVCTNFYKVLTSQGRIRASRDLGGMVAPKWVP